MKPTLIIFSVLSIFATGTEAANLFKYLLCGGRSDAVKYKKSQVMPATNFNDDVETIECTPFNSDRSVMRIEFSQDEDHKSAFEENVPTAKKAQKYMTKQTAVVPAPDIEEDEYLNEDSMKRMKADDYDDSDSETISSTKKLERILDGNGIHIRNLNLSEEGASELLHIRIPLMIVLSFEKRAELMVHELEFKKPDDRKGYSSSKILKFNIEISEDLSKVKTMKDLLRIVVKFYKRCFSNLLLNQCTKAILAADVFDIYELPTVFGMHVNDIFQFACENSLNDLAIALIPRITDQKTNLREGALKALDEGNYKLSGDLLEVHRSKFGDDANSDFHNVLFDIVDEQLVA